MSEHGCYDKSPWVPRAAGDEHGLAEREATELARNRDLASLYEDALGIHRDPSAVARWVLNTVQRELKERSLDDLPFGGVEFGELIALVEGGSISGGAAKDVLTQLANAGGSPRAIVERLGLERSPNAEALAPAIDAVLALHSEPVERYRAGKESLLGLFVGKVLAKTQGRADPEIVKSLIREKLAAS